jgi:hypothetical protein
MSVQRLAGAIRRLADRRKICADLRVMIDEVKRGGFVMVDGELDELVRLESLLAEGDVALRRLSAPETASEDEIAALEEVIDDPLWSVEDLLKVELATKKQMDADLRAKCQADLNRQSDLLSSVRDAIEQARAVFAATRRDEKELRRLTDVETQARRALVGPEPQPELFAQRLQMLVERDLASIAAEVRRRTDGPQHWKQAELLLLRSPLDDVDHYSVILRTPSEPGSHGLNIQGPSNVPVQLRREMLERAAQLEQGVRQYRSTRDANGGAVGQVQVGHERELEQTARDLGGEMFSLILPTAIRDYILDANYSVTITTNDLELPWELMHRRETFLCLDRPIARMPMAAAFPRRPGPRPPLNKQLRFLLIGADGRGELPGVQREIDRIKTALLTEFGDSIEVHTYCSPDARSRVLVNALKQGRYDVIHYAGHAAFDRSAPHSSRLLLDDGSILAENIGRLIEGSPVVFLNACETTATRNAPDRAEGQLAAQAEGLASAFIHGGALGCIGTLWPIHDGAAADFAIAFYGQLLEGQTIGKSMLHARHAVRANGISWASFVLFGNPLFRLDWRPQ